MALNKARRDGIGKSQDCVEREHEHTEQRSAERSPLSCQGWPDGGTERGDARERPDQDPDLGDLAILVVANEIGALDRATADVGAPEERVCVAGGQRVGDLKSPDGVKEDLEELDSRVPAAEGRLEYGRVHMHVGSEGLAPGMEIARLPRGAVGMDLHEPDASRKAPMPRLG